MDVLLGHIKPIAVELDAVDVNVFVVALECLVEDDPEGLHAVDGVAGWNALRLGNYDLLLTDVDMPRMTGIDLTRAVRDDARLRDLPVMIVSYKEREEDRLAGFEAGADRYITKASFRDDSLLKAVEELIGGPWTE